VFADHVPRNVTGLAFDVAAGLGMEFGPALAMPLGADDNLAGVLLAIRAVDSPAFDEQELELLATFADQAGLALQRADNQAAQRELEVLADRDRIARDLHEHVIGRLFGIGLALHGTHRLARSPAVTARIADHIDQLNEVIAEVRAAVFDLHTDPAETPRLGGVLTSIVEDITADADLHTSIGFSGRIDQHPPGPGRTGPGGAPGSGQQHRATRPRHRAHRHGHRRRPPGHEVTDNGTGIPGTVARSGLHNLTTRARAVRRHPHR